MYLIRSYSAHPFSTYIYSECCCIREYVWIGAYTYMNLFTHDAHIKPPMCGGGDDWLAINESAAFLLNCI